MQQSQTSLWLTIGNLPFTEQVFFCILTHQVWCTESILKKVVAQNHQMYFVTVSIPFLQNITSTSKKLPRQNYAFFSFLTVYGPLYYTNFYKKFLHHQNLPPLTTTSKKERQTLDDQFYQFRTWNMGPARSKGTGEEHGNSIKKTIGFRHYENVFKIKTLSARAQTECPVANERSI